MYKCSLFVSSHVSCPDFLWLNKHILCKKKIFLRPWISCWPQVCWVSAVQSRHCWLLCSHVECRIQLPWRGLCGGKKTHPWLAVTRRALACQLPHKPVLPPLGSSTQVWELIILIQEKQLHNNKTKQANKTKENKNQDKPPNKQVNLRKVYRHLTLPFLPLGHAAYFPGNCSPAAACPCQADGREKGISLQKESDPTPHRHSTVFPYGRTEHINRANGNRKQNLKALSFSVHMGFQLFSSRLHYRTSWQWDAGSSVPSTSLSADVLGKKRLSAS